MPRADYHAFPYRTPPELSGGTPGDAPVAIIGAGPVGLAVAIDLALHGVKCVVLDDNNTVSVGSRAICWAKRTLEIFDRLGVGERMVAKGVTWKVGRLFHGEKEVWNFDLLPEEGHKNPAFINLQQYHVEQYLVERCADFPDLIDLRWKNKVTGVAQDTAQATLTVQTPDGAYNLAADYVVACDGARSPTRAMMGLEFQGRFFEERFLIADVEMKIEQPSERWFWFDPPFNRNQSALLHKQPDDIWRLDFQLGWDIDREASVQPENVEPLIRGLLGPDVAFEQEWYSVYTFQCRRMSRFVHGRVIFAGDSAHVVSPFGARGCNGGLADAANLGWKLDLVIRGEASTALIESYNEEAIIAADENIRHSSRATDFMSPKTAAGRTLRDAVLELANDHDWARGFVNSGRLSTAVDYRESALNTADTDDGWHGLAPGTPASDALLASGSLLQQLGEGFTLIGYHAPAALGLPLVEVGDGDDVAIDRYDLKPGTVYLVRPDHYVAARWRRVTRETIEAAVATASCPARQ